MTEFTNIDQAKRMHLDSVLQGFYENSYEIKEEAAKNKASNLVLMTLQDDKKCTDGWTAFGRIGFDKSF